MADGLDRSTESSHGIVGTSGDALYKLMTWLSPAYPIGSFVYSHGLEAAVRSGKVWNASSSADWIRTCILHGNGRTDAILLAQSWHAESRTRHASLTDMDESTELTHITDLDELAQLAYALSPSAERLLETQAQGEAFADVTAAVWGAGGPSPYPIAVGRTAARHDVPLEATLIAYVQAFAANLVSAAARLVPLGQVQGQKIMFDLMEDILRTAREATHADLEAIGTMTLASDVASMRHETQDVRLFKT